MIRQGSSGTFYACFLEPSPGPGAALPEPLFVNPGFWWQPGPSPPLEVFRRVESRDGFLGGYPLAWVEDRRSRMLNPYWVPHRWASVLASLRAGQPAPAMDPEIATALWDAEILVGTREGCARASAESDSAAARFAAKGYAPIEGLLHRSQTHALANYYRRLSSSLETIGDSQCARRHGMHNERIARFLLRQMQWLVSEVAGEEVLPSYAYFAGYRGGAELVRHTDREQCEFSVTLLVDYDAPGGPSSWPIHLETADGPVAIRQSPGDALVYKGRQLPHWRDVLPAGCASNSVLLHYVRQDFTGSLR